MKPAGPFRRTAILALFLSTTAFAFIPSPSRADAYEETQRIRKAELERIRQREAEAKRRIEQKRDRGSDELKEVAPSVQRCRENLSFATQTAKTWSEQRLRMVPTELMSQGKKYRDRVAAIEKTYQECGSMLHSSSYVMTDVLNRIATLKASAESTARDGDRFCLSVLNLYADEGRESLRGIDMDLKSSSGSVSRIRGAIQQMTVRDLKAANERREAREKAARASGQTKSANESENDAFRRRRREYEEERMNSQAISQAKWDAEEAKRKLEYRLSDLERTYDGLSRRRERCEASLSSAVLPDRYRYRYASDDNAASAWDAALQSVQAELGTIETLKTDVAAFCAAVAELESNASPLAKEDAKPDVPAPAEEPPEKAKKPKRPASCAPCISWSPWDEAALSKAKPAK